MRTALVMLLWLVATAGVVYVANTAVELVDLQVFPGGSRIEVLSLPEPEVPPPPTIVATTSVPPQSAPTVPVTSPSTTAPPPNAPPTTTTITVLPADPIGDAESIEESEPVEGSEPVGDPEPAGVSEPTEQESAATSGSIAPDPEGGAELTGESEPIAVEPDEDPEPAGEPQTVAEVPTTTAVPTTTVSPATAQSPVSTTTTLAPATTTRAPTTTVAPPMPLVVVTPSLPEARIGESYRVELLAAGGTPPYVWSLSAGSMPAGLGLSADGVIDGVVAETVDISLLFRAVDGAGQSATSSPLVLSTAADRRTVVARGGTVFIDNDGDSVTLFLVSPADGFSAVIVDPGGFRVEVQFVPLLGDATSFVVCEVDDGLVCTTG